MKGIIGSKDREAVRLLIESSTPNLACRDRSRMNEFKTVLKLSVWKEFEGLQTWYVFGYVNDGIENEFEAVTVFTNSKGEKNWAVRGIDYGELGTSAVLYEKIKKQERKTVKKMIKKVRKECEKANEARKQYQHWMYGF